MREYTDDVLHRVWRTEMEIYREIARICGARGLRYYVGYGTALGAVRHKGFIPWDDDMDVYMPRKDYEVFLKAAEKELPEKMGILGIGYTKGYVMPFVKIHNRNTTFVEETDQDRKYHSGIFVDVLPMDAAAPTEELKKKQYARCWRWGRACVLSEYGKPKLPKGMSVPARMLARAGCLVIHGVFRLLRLKPEFFYSRFLKAARQYETEDEPKEYAQFGDMSVKPEYDRAETLFPAKTVPFEDMEVRIPADADTYLTNLYGDYMKIPPAEKRYNHFPAVLKFEETEA